MRSVDYYELVAEAYDSMYEDEYWRRAFGHIEQLLLTTVGDFSGKRVLDVGAGTGRWAARALLMGAHVTIVEPAAKMLEVAKRKLRLLNIPANRYRTLQLMAEELSTVTFEDRFDVVFLLGDVLSYVENVELVLRNISAVTKSGAIVVGTVDSFLFNLKEVLLNGTAAEVRTFLETSTLLVGSEYGCFRARVFDVGSLQELFERFGFGGTEVSALGIFKSPRLNLRYAGFLSAEAEHLVYVARKV